MDTLSDINQEDAFIYQKPQKKPLVERSTLNKIFVVTIAVIALTGIGYRTLQLRQTQNVVSQASQQATLVVSSSKPSVVVGEEFTVSILIDTKNQDITGAQLYFSYPENSVEVISTDVATFLPSLLSPGTAAGGSGFIVVGSDTPQNGSGVIAAIQLKATQASSQPIEIRIDESRTKILTASQTPLGVTTIPAFVTIAQ